MRHLRPAVLAENRFIRFLFIGCVNTVFGYSLFCLFLYLGLAPLAALTLATVFGVCFNFFTTGKVVFRRLDPARFRSFVLVYVVYLAVNAMLLEGLRMFGLSAYVAQAVLLPPLVIGLYLAQRRFVFNVSNGEQLGKASS